MSKLQLENLRKRIGGVCPQLVENGKMLHIRRNPMGGFNEWIVLTYNLQILGQYIRENIGLRKKIVELMDTYINQITILGNVKPGSSGPTPNNPAAPADPSDPNYMFRMLSHRMDESDKKFDKLEQLIKDKLGDGW